MASSSSSDSDTAGGGAPLHSPPRATKPTPQKREEQAEKSKSSTSPSDDELALVKAGSLFGQLGQALQTTNGGSSSGAGPSTSFNYGSIGSRNNGAATLASQGLGQNGGDPFVNQTPRPSTAFQPSRSSPYKPGSSARPSNYGQASPFAQRQGPEKAIKPPGALHYGSDPYLQECSDIQGQLFTSQQYIRITPGVPSEVADNIQRMLVATGQKLNAFTSDMIKDTRQAKHQVGECRVMIERLQNEVITRKRQIEELQAAIRNNQNQDTKVVNLSRQVRSLEAELSLCKDTMGTKESEYKSQVKKLEDALAKMRVNEGASMQMVKSKHAAAIDEESESEETSLADKRGKRPSSRRGSALNPNAPSFGPNSKEREAPIDLMPLLKDYERRQSNAREAAAREAAARDPFAHQTALIKAMSPERPITPLAMKPEYARQFGSHQEHRFNHQRPNQFERPGTRMGQRRDTSSSGYSSIGGPSSFFNPTTAATFNSSNFQFGDPFRSNFPGGIGGGVLGGPLTLTPDWAPKDIAAAFTRMYDTIEGAIATAHAQPPFNESDELLPVSEPLTWDYIIAIGLPGNKANSASHMAHLLGQPTIRHFVVKRLIVDYIFHRMIQPEVFFGFSDQVDSHLRALQERMRSRFPGDEAPGRPQGKMRQRIIEDHAKVIQHIISCPEGAAFARRVVEHHTTMLCAILRPMRNVSTDSSEAAKAFRVVVNAAWKISSRVWSSGATVHFFFPETGSKFSFGQMRPMNHGHVAPEQMQYSQFRVMLVVTPTLSLRDDRDLGSLRTFELMKSDVLVMK